MKKIVFGCLLLFIAILSIFSYRKYSGCKKLEFVDILNKEYIYVDKGSKTDINLTFTDDRIFGSGGINRYFAGYKEEDGNLQFSPIGSTMMAGPEDKMNLERSYLDFLNNVNKVNACGNKLFLITKNNEKLEFIENTSLNEESMNNANNSSDVVGPKMNTSEENLNDSNITNESEDSMDMDSDQPVNNI